MDSCVEISGFASDCASSVSTDLPEVLVFIKVIVQEVRITLIVIRVIAFNTPDIRLSMFHHLIPVLLLYFLHHFGSSLRM